ncbi:MAG: hypothetical protein KGL31_14260 [candidate division NC10 bacterium]|nr:hypothetical protein [candidate division NC10 bacterium]MDE2323042.1 hypothetical protein [candidate division NC10 bacterium]
MKSALVLAASTVAVASYLMVMPVPVNANDFSIGINVGAPPPPPAIVLPAPPPLVVVPGTPVYYAPSVSVNFFAYDRRYYSHHNGAWFVAPSYAGPWSFIAVERVPRPVLAVPVAYYKVPPGHWKRGEGRPHWAGRGRGFRHKEREDD